MGQGNDGRVRVLRPTHRLQAFETGWCVSFPRKALSGDKEYEGFGDYSNLTVSKVSNGILKEVFRSKKNRVGTLYKMITLMLGMKISHQLLHLMNF